MNKGDNKSADNAVYASNLTGLPLVSQGKVRDIYAVGDSHLLIVTTDRLSAFDVVLPDPIPGKGEVLTRLSNFWFGRTRKIVRNHLVDIALDEVLPDAVERARVSTRSMVVRRLRPLPIEAVVRGYLIGSGWKDYQASGAVCGIPLPEGLPLAARLPAPIFTPASKAPAGDHDENVTFADVERLIGAPLAATIRDLAVQLYLEGARHAQQRGIIIADTKFEFGLDGNDDVYLIDEVMTPDSSRFWPADGYRTGISPPSFDKQYVRDYLETLVWDKRAPGPRLPAEVIGQTAARYRRALELLTA